MLHCFFLVQHLLFDPIHNVCSEISKDCMRDRFVTFNFWKTKWNNSKRIVGLVNVLNRVWSIRISLPGRSSATSPVNKQRILTSRGGVEDTRLEAKAKDTKKNPRPRPRPRIAFPRTDTLEAKDRNARGQGQGPRTQSASALQKKKKKKVFTKIFQAISTKKRFPKNFSTAPQNFNFPKNSAVLEPRTGQFSRTWGLEAKAKAKDFKICPRGRPRGQGRPRGLHLC